MFTGIVQTQIVITAVDTTDNVVDASFSGVADLKLAVGDSLLVNGICSTITHISGDVCTVQYMPQTVRLTTVESWKVGKTCNAETSLTLNTPLSGWLVTGHIDTVGSVLNVEQSGSDVVITVSFSNEYTHLVVQQGTITIDGVNLTVTNVTDTTCTVHIIPFTREHTSLHSISPGDRVNLEFDYFAKLTAQQMQRIQPQ